MAGLGEQDQEGFCPSLSTPRGDPSALHRANSAASLIIAAPSLIE